MLRTGYKGNSEVRRARECRNYAADPERIKAKNRAFAAMRPEIRINIRNRRKALYQSAGNVRRDAVSDLLVLQMGLCANPFCAKNIIDCFTLDHKTPLSRGGTNRFSNLQLLCGPCNDRKYIKTQREWNKHLVESIMAKAKQTESIASGYDYETTKIRGKDGKVRSSRGNNDAVAKAMLLFTAGGGDLVTVVNANKLQEKMAPHLKKKGPKAPGLVRMCLGVMLRALVRNGTPVKIGREIIEKLSQKVELPKVEKIERAAKAAKPAKKSKAAKPKAPRKARAKKEVPAELVA